MSRPDNEIDPLEKALVTYLGSLSSDSIHEPIRYLLSLGGKKIRPRLVLIGCELFGGDVSEAMPVALAVEVFHNFTLMHDDIMDKAPLRRGQPTVHEKWNTNTAILSGDAMLIHAYGLLLQSTSSRIHDIMRIFNKTAIDVCQGQQLDMEFERRKNVGESEYLEMIRLKTSVLLGGALRMGAQVAGAPEKEYELIQSFGENLGIAFQLHDDLLDAFGDRSLVGKQVGGDILSDKKTFLLIRSLSKAGPAQLSVLGKYLHSSPELASEKVSAIVNVYRELGIEKDTTEKMNQYYDQALQSLNAIDLVDGKKEVLRKLAADIMQRTF